MRTFTPEMLGRFRADAEAWAFWQRQPAGGRRVTESWVCLAKQEGTHEPRPELLMTHARKGERIPALLSPAEPRLSDRAASSTAIPPPPAPALG